MVEYSLGEINIKINLDNGVYIFGSGGGTGKTRLYELLKGLPKQYSVSIASYDDRTNSVNYDIDWSSNVIMIDRFDLFISKEFCEHIKSALDDSIILCALKDYIKFNEYGVKFKFADLELTGDSSVEIFL